MRAIFKFTAAFLALLTLLFFSLILILVTFVSPNNFKSQISQQAYNYTGRQLSLNGDLHWSFFPWLGIQVNDAALSNSKGFGNQPFMQVKRINVSVKLIPLIHRHFEIGHILLDGMEINLVKTAKGNNWQDIKPIGTPSNSTAAPDPIKTDSAAASYSDFKIAGIKIVNSKVTWFDQQKNQKIILDQINFAGKDIQPNQAFPIDLKFALHAKQPATDGTIIFKGQITPNLEKDVYQIQNLKLICDLVGKSLPGEKLKLNVRGNLAYDKPNQRVTGQLATDQLVLNNFKAANVSLGINSKDSIWNLSPIAAQMYQGTYAGSVKLNLQNSAPQISSNANLSNIQIAPLLKELANFTRLQLTGSGNLVLNITTKGADANTILKNLNGQGQFSLNNGVLYGMNIPYWIGTGVALLNKQPIPSMNNSKQTDFGNLTGTFTIKNGVVQNNDLSMKSSQLTVSGSGQADLVQQRINYKLQAQMLDAASKQAQGNPVPITITGNLASPSIRPDVGTILKDEIKTQLVKHKEVIGKEIGKLLGNSPKLQNALQNFLKQ